MKIATSVFLGLIVSSSITPCWSSNTYSLENKFFRIELDEQKQFEISSVASNVHPSQPLLTRVALSYLTLKWNPESVQKSAECRIIRDTEKQIARVHSWGTHFDIKKEITVFRTKPYFAVDYYVEALEPTHISPNNGLTILVYANEKRSLNKVYLRNNVVVHVDEPRSHSVPEVWYSFYDPTTLDGVCIVATEKRLWRREGNKQFFSMQYVPTLNQPNLRKGDKIHFRFFVAVFAGDAVDESCGIANEIVDKYSDHQTAFIPLIDPIRPTAQPQ